MFERFDTIANAPMKDFTTLRLGGPADYLAFPRSAREVGEMFEEAGECGVPVTVIGHGSNLLVLDGGIRGLVIRLERGMRAVRIEGTTIRAEAGAMLSAVARAAAEAGLSGLEFAAGIPGTVGGGLFMNAGAYDGEMADVVLLAEGIRPDGAMMSVPREELEFGYRHSAIADKGMIVTSATLEMKRGNPAEIQARMADFNARRAEKQPLDLPSAGSAFKRPEGAFAAALIDQCGLKGYSIGGARVSEKHAGFLVNTGTSSADFLALMNHVRKIVRERAGVELEPEIRILGEEVPG